MMYTPHESSTSLLDNDKPIALLVEWSKMACSIVCGVGGE